MDVSSALSPHTLLSRMTIITDLYTLPFQTIVFLEKEIWKEKKSKPLFNSNILHPMISEKRRRKRSWNESNVNKLNWLQLHELTVLTIGVTPACFLHYWLPGPNQTKLKSNWKLQLRGNNVNFFMKRVQLVWTLHFRRMFSFRLFLETFRPLRNGIWVWVICREFCFKVEILKLQINLLSCVSG